MQRGKGIRNAPEEKGTVEISEGKLTSQCADNICHRLLLLNNLIIVKGKALLRELQFGLDAAVLLKEGLEGVGPEVESVL